MSDQLYISELFSSIQGEGMLAGRRQVFIRLMECNLDCRYCDTDFAPAPVCRCETSPGSGTYRDIDLPMPLSAMCHLLGQWLEMLPGAHHSVSITGGEPLLHAGILARWLPEIRNMLPVHLETNGTLPDALHLVKGMVDYISMDMKLPSTAGCSENLWERHARFLAEAAGCAVSVKIVVGDETPVSEIHQVCDIMSSVDSTVPLYLQPVSLSRGIGISAGHILLLQAAAASRLPDVRVIPQMHKMMSVL